MEGVLPPERTARVENVFPLPKAQQKFQRLCDLAGPLRGVLTMADSLGRTQIGRKKEWIRVQVDAVLKRRMLPLFHRFPCILCFVRGRFGGMILGVFCGLCLGGKLSV